MILNWWGGTCIFSQLQIRYIPATVSPEELPLMRVSKVIVERCSLFLFPKDKVSNRQSNVSSSPLLCKPSRDLWIATSCLHAGNPIWCCKPSHTTSVDALCYLPHIGRLWHSVQMSNKTLRRCLTLQPRWRQWGTAWHLSPCQAASLQKLNCGHSRYSNTSWLQFVSSFCAFVRPRIIFVLCQSEHGK